MHKILPVVILFVFVLATPTTSLGQTATDTTPTVEPSKTTLPVRPTIAAGKEERLETKQTFRENALEKKAETQKNLMKKKEDLLKKRLEVRSELKERRAELKQEIAAKRLEAKKEFKEERLEFKEKLETIRDERKQAVVEKLDSKLSTVNTEKTTRMQETLEKLNTGLSKISEHADTLTKQGIDTTALTTAISNASAALASAETAVTTQAGKEYVIEIQDETTLRSTVGATTSQMQTDLRDTHKTVVAAKDAIKEAARELSKLKKQGETATGSAVTQ